MLPNHEVLAALGRHARGDWGTVGEEDWASNDRALVEEARLLSAYCSEGGIRFWIITEWDRSLTTVLLPEDY
ncbi:MAG: plasmid related protein [Limisphaerales bacterium]